MSRSAGERDSPSASGPLETVRVLRVVTSVCGVPQGSDLGPLLLSVYIMLIYVDLDLIQMKLKTPNN